MSFFQGFSGELCKLAISDELKQSLSAAVGKNAGEGAVDRAAEKLGPYKKDIAGLGIGALAGKALLGKGALGALLGLGVARHKEVADIAKKGYGAAKKKIDEARK